MAEANITFDYEISFPDGKTQTFHLELDPDSLALIPIPQERYPEWTKLGCFQCSRCPLDPKDHPRCPVAENLVVPTTAFARDLSYKEVEVVIRTPSRNYQKKIALQNALRSLFGIYMTTSGCPILDKLRPLVASHLPFASVTETAFRVFSMYALAQCFIQKRGGTPDWDFKRLGKIYQDVEGVNRDFHRRLVSAGLQDASLNAITNLNCYAQFNQMLLEPHGLGRIERLFKPYF
ncbi:MAG: hypothetical protein KTQ49_01870 [Candidatus Omnitrophica bacterium]|nr:hypothetical protein [Candidatus Omnitrophota bacterium]